MNRKADFFTKLIDSHNESIRIANCNALLGRPILRGLHLIFKPSYEGRKLRLFLGTRGASGRSHMRVLPPGTLCPTTSAPCLILSSSENCLNHTILVKLLTFVDSCFFSRCFSIWLTFVMHPWSRFS